MTFAETTWALLAQTSPVRAEDFVAILPALILLATGLAVLMIDIFLRGWKEPAEAEEKSVLHFVSLLGTCMSAALVCAWLARGDLGHRDYFVGAVIVNPFTLSVSLLIILGTLLCLLSSVDALSRRRLVHGEFHCLVLFAAGSMVLFTQSNSLLMLFLSLETLSMAVFVLTAYTRDDRRSVEGALKYFLLGGFSSSFLLFGLVFLYGATSTMNLGEIAAIVAAPDGQVDVPLLLAGFGLILIGLGFKVGAFPFHSWVPDAYEGAPTVVTGFMAVTVKVASFAVLLRFAFLFLEAAETGGPGTDQIQQAGVAALSLLAILSMVFANVVAVVQSSVKRMLAYSAIAHTGYLLVGVVSVLSGSPEGQQPGQISEAGPAVLFYLLPYSLMTVGAFTVISYLGHGEKDRETFADYRGLAQQRPLMALGLLVLMVSFAGIPPTAGFWGKLYVFKEAVSSGHWPLALVGIVTSIISVYYYLRLVVNMYMRPAEESTEGEAPTSLPPLQENQTASGIVVGFAAVAVVLVGLMPDAFLKLSVQAFAGP